MLGLACLGGSRVGSRVAWGGIRHGFSNMGFGVTLR